jgi:hypothetical protein
MMTNSEHQFFTISSYSGHLEGVINFSQTALNWYPDKELPACMYVEREKVNGEMTGLVKMTIYIDTQEANAASEIGATVLSAIREQV